MKRLTFPMLATFALAAMLTLTACDTGVSGVESNRLSQYGKFLATAPEATIAAADTLEELELKKVNSSSTRVDGQAIGYMADGTKVVVDIKQMQEDPKMVEVSTSVGSLGDPNIGIEIMSKIKKRLAENN